MDINLIPRPVSSVMIGDVLRDLITVEESGRTDTGERVRVTFTHRAGNYTRIIAIDEFGSTYDRTFFGACRLMSEPDIDVE